MLSQSTCRLIIIGLLTMISARLNAQQINTDALTAYWKLTEKVTAGDTISKQQWQDFLNLPGNRQYITNQGFDQVFLDNYRRNIQFVYNPKNADKLKKLMEHKFDYWQTYKVNQYKDHEAELKNYAAHLHDAAYLDSMYKNAWAWLPAKLRGKHPSTVMYFIGIDNDAIVQGDTIVFTLWSAYNQDKLKYGSLGGHELHHQLRAPVDMSPFKPEDEGVMYLLNNILNEGTADMVDKHYGLANLKTIPTEFQFDDMLLNHPDSIIRQIDTSMQVMKQTNGAKFMTVKQYRKLINYSSGHDPGYYMADIIVRNGYKKELMANIQNPFYFIYLYNKAAQKDAKHPPLFSISAIDYVKELENRYWKH